MSPEAPDLGASFLVTARLSCISDGLLLCNFQQELSPAVREVLKEELAAIVIPIRGAGRLAFPQRSGARAMAQRSRECDFQGALCGGESLAASPAPMGVGQTQVIDGRVIPYADVHCDEIRAALGAELVSAAPGRRSLVFGRAISRVVTHELHHILTKTTGHGAGGMTKWSYTAQDLVSDQFRFVDREVEQPRRALLPSPAKPTPRSETDSCRTE